MTTGTDREDRAAFCANARVRAEAKEQAADLAEDPKRKLGRPPKPIPRIDASPERIARAIFAAAKRPDPSLRKPRRGAAATGVG